jgi:hypothetical protein
VTEPADFDALIDFFDSIGIIKRCHSRSMALKHCEDVIILKPQWLVNVFSAVITCYNLDDPAKVEGAVMPALATALSSDFYRFESKAILSVGLLRHLWEQKGVISMLEGVQNHEREQWAAKFELLLELLLRFDLMFELKDVGFDGGGPSDGLQDPLDGRRFLVPAMLVETSVPSAFPRRGGEPAAQPPLYCYFAFKEGGVSLARGSGGLLPAVVFAKLQARCASWAQSTSNTEPRLTRRHAEVTFGAQQFELNLVQERCMIEVVLRTYSRPDEIVSLLQHVLIAKILADSFPSITFDINVRDADSGDYLPLQRVRQEVGTRKEFALDSNESTAFETFKFRGGIYECAQFEAWVPKRPINREDYHITGHGGLFDLFICAHESDLQFVGKLYDCLRKITGGKARIKFSSRVAKFLAPGAALQQQDEWAGKDVFAIANSGVFVPIISAACLEQWSFEKRAPTTRFARLLAISMAVFAFVELFTDGLLALRLSTTSSTQQEGQMYLCYTVIFSLTVPSFIHTFVVRQLFIKEPHSGKNKAFIQWMQVHQAWLPLLFFLGAIRPDILRSLLTSGAFGWSVFRCPLSIRSSRRLVLAGTITNLLHDLPQLFVSIMLLHLHHRNARSDFATYLFAAGTTVSSAIALIYSVFSRLSAALLLRVASFAYADIGRDEDGVDEMMMEYMTALMSQADRQGGGRTRSRSISQSLLKFCGGEGLPRLIVPLVVDEIFETGNKMTTGGHPSMAADAMLLHPIGDNQISTATLRTHDQIMRSDLDLQGKESFTGRFTGAPGEATASAVVDAILGHCAVDEKRGGTQVFSVRRDRWGRCDAAAEHVVAKLRSIASERRPVQNQSTRGRSANTRVRRTLGTPSSLEAGEGDTAIHHGATKKNKNKKENKKKIGDICETPGCDETNGLELDHSVQEWYCKQCWVEYQEGEEEEEAAPQAHGCGVSSIDGLSTPLLQPHSEQSGTDSTNVSSSGGWAPPTSTTGSIREFSSHTSMTGYSIASKSARSAYHSAADTTSMRSFKTANEGSTASLNDGEGGDGGSVLDSTSVCSFTTAEDLQRGHCSATQE